MVRSFSAGSAIRLGLIAVAAISMAACQSKKPKYPAQTTGPTTAPQTQLPPSQNNPPPVGSQAAGAIPGSAQDFVVNVGDRVYFDLNEYTIRDDARPVLDAQSNWLRRYSGVRVRIEGNADERGTREFNLALGARRANAVRDYLVSHGVSADRISTISFGKESPLDPGTSEEAYQKNRNGHTAIVDGAR
jgi:peptidoglycan-associated lipoprotein